jgi:hypothetical protein
MIVVVNESAESMWLSVIKLTLVDLSRNQTMSTDAVVLIVLVDLTEIFVEAILVGKLHQAKTIVNFDLASVDPFLKRYFLHRIPLVGTSLVARFILPR